MEIRQLGLQTYVSEEDLTAQYNICSRSLWPRGLSHELPSLAQTLGSWVLVPLDAWMSVCVYSVFVFCV
jgi:hypothetical protein